MKIKDRNQRAKLKKWIEHTLNKFNFVRWDRYIAYSEMPVILVYGWINREQDNYKDFLVLEFNYSIKKVYFTASSSEKYSKEICKILDLKKYKVCNRVEHGFNVLKSIKLKNVT